MKKAISLILCFAMLLSCAAFCAGAEAENGLNVALNVLYNDTDLGCTSTEYGAPVAITGDGQYTATFDIATDLSESAAGLGVTEIQNLTAIFLYDHDVRTGTQKKSNVTSCEIRWDAVAVNGQELTLTNSEFKSAIKTSGIFDTNDPFNAWDGSAVEEVTTDTAVHSLRINVDKPTTVSVTFTVRGLTFAQAEPEATTAPTAAPVAPKVEVTEKTSDETGDDMNTSLTALELVHLMGNGENLGNTMEACDTGLGSVYSANPSYYETSWGQPITTRESIQGMKAAGFDTLRIPVAWMTNATKLGETGDYTIATEYLDRVEEIVSWALDADMFVILNDHWDGGWYGMFGSESQQTRDLAMEAYKGMWQQLCDRFEKYDYHLIFEGANEEIGARFDENSPLYCDDSVITYYTEDEKYELANLVNQTFVDVVRASGGNNAQRFLLIPGFGTNIDNTCDDRFVMPTDTVQNKLLISVHYYDPWSYCGDGQSSVKWGTKSDIQYMIDTLGKMTKFTEQGYGVVIGEYGVLYSTEIQDNTELYHQCFLDVCDLNGFTSCLWDCNAFYKRTEGKIVDELAKLYAKRNVKSFALMTQEEEGIMATRRLKAAMEEAPETFRTDAIQVEADSAVAWIMWNSGSYTVTYSVGDEYNPDSITDGLKETDVLITGEGTYTVALDFTGTAQGYSDGTAFSALAVMNGELLFPGYVIDIQEVKINGEAYTLAARPYTSSDNEITTRVNLFNEWVKALPNDARTLNGDLTGCAPCILNRNDSCISSMESIEITFYYGPAK